MNTASHKFNLNKNILAVIILGAVALIYMLSSTGDTTFSGYQKKSAKINNKEITLYLANTEKRQELGLGGTKELKRDAGMLFLFDKDDFWSIWMKDMLIPIDVIWLNEKYEVIYIVPNMRPEDYPKIYTPSTLARYVIEVNSGFVKENSIEIGQKFEIK